jgi:hypothetical protein
MAEGRRAGPVRRALAPVVKTISVYDERPEPASASDFALDPERSIDPGLLLELFGQAPIVFNRLYVDISGSVTSALWLAYAVYHVCERESAPGNWFSKSQQDWERETGLSRREQESARKQLRTLGVLEEQRRPNAPLAYRLVLARLYALMETHSQKIKAEYLAARNAHG